MMMMMNDNNNNNINNIGYYKGDLHDCNAKLEIKL